ncbi:MAG TPA: gliding motility-associated C-terminal domain-containing protein, partial [Panacibacter sp.]|nr:gliding motility-associated C-terminal domain-containing protein [Panacibacter sp.]
DTSIAVNQPLQLNATDITNSGFTSYSWSPSSGLNNPFIQNPIAVLNKNIIYTVTAQTPDDCRASDNIAITVYRDADIYVPTAFTPNGDGRNDVEKAFPAGIKIFKYFTIFNRYGETVFTTSDASVGWDGIYKGQRQASGTFVWKAEGVDYNGRTIFKKGTVVLIR